MESSAQVPDPLTVVWEKTSAPLTDASSVLLPDRWKLRSVVAPEPMYFSAPLLLALMVALLAAAVPLMVKERSLLPTPPV